LILVIIYHKYHDVEITRS